MAQVSKTDKDALHSTVTVTLEKSDYQPKVDEELRHYRKQAAIKGFRPGKTPMSVLRKMYGKSIRSEVVNRRLQEELYNFLEAENIQVLGSPIPAEEQELLDFDSPQAYTVAFDLGLAPEVEVKGMDESTVLEKPVPEIPESDVDEELERLRKQAGERIEVDENIAEDDVITLEVAELEESGSLRADGATGEFPLMVNRAQEDVKNQLLNKKKGDRLTLNLFELEPDTDEAYVRKHYLDDMEDTERELNPFFQATVAGITRLVPAELNEDFFAGVFGEEDSVQDEAEARERIRQHFSQHYERQADALVFRAFQDFIMEHNAPPLPDDFLKRWLILTNEEVTEANIEGYYERFSKNLRWTLLRNKMLENLGLEVTDEEVVERMREQIRGYFGGQADDNLIGSMTERMLEDRKQYDRLEDEIYTDKLQEAAKEHITIEVVKVTKEEFEARVEEAQRSARAAQQLPEEEE